MYLMFIPHLWHLCSGVHLRLLNSRTLSVHFFILVIKVVTITIEDGITGRQFLCYHYGDRAGHAKGYAQPRCSEGTSHVITAQGKVYKRYQNFSNYIKRF